MSAKNFKISIGDVEVVLGHIETMEDLKCNKLEYHGRIYKIIKVDRLKPKINNKWIQRSVKDGFN